VSGGVPSRPLTDCTPSRVFCVTAHDGLDSQVDSFLRAVMTVYDGVCDGVPVRPRLPVVLRGARRVRQESRSPLELRLAWRLSAGFPAPQVLLRRLGGRGMLSTRPSY